MNSRGGEPANLLVQARSALIDAAEALVEHRDALVLIGAQAVYLHTGSLDVALAETTKDSDVALDSRVVADVPLLDDAMIGAGFYRSDQPGSWLNPDGIPVDLMVPELLAGGGEAGARGARIPPHSKFAARRARGLEAAMVDNDRVDIPALDPLDQRMVRLRVAGPAALLIAKLHKIAERVEKPHRLSDKDAHDAYRILRAIDTQVLAETISRLRTDELCGVITEEALISLDELFARSPAATGAVMAGRAEEGLGDPEQVAVATFILAQDLMSELR